MEARIEILSEKKLLGKSIRMNLADNKTSELWQGFMQQKNQIKNALGSDLYSIQIYDYSVDFKDFNPLTKFEKWAAIEVSDFNTIPEGMKSFTLKSGLYAVFIHKGAANEFQKTFQFIFGQWLPTSKYNLDDRPHFELLGKKYKNNHPNSEEEVWIPIKAK